MGTGLNDDAAVAQLKEGLALRLSHRPGAALGPRAREFRLERLLIVAYAAGLFGALSALARAASAWPWADPAGPAGILLVGLIGPYLVWTYLIGLVDLVHHTHPRAVCFADPSEWNYFEAAVCSTVHVILPMGLNWAANNILEHNAHHVDPRVPLYNLPDAQARLEADATQNAARAQELDQLTSRETSTDLTSSVVQLTQTQAMYEAALQSGAKIMQMSILDYVR